LVDTLHDATIVPLAAIQRGALGTFVYLVKAGDTVAAQRVTLGPSDTQNVAITEGLTQGEAVVTDGADRLKDGAKVRLIQPGRPAAEPTAGSPPPAPATERKQQRSGGRGLWRTGGALAPTLPPRT